MRALALLVVSDGPLDHGGMDEDEDRPGDDGDGELPRDEGDDGQKEEGEGEVYVGEDGGRGYEVSDGLEALDDVGEGAHGGGAVFGSEGEDLLHELGGEFAVGFGGGFVHEAAAGGGDHEVGEDHDEDPRRGGKEGVGGPVGDDPVVDVHGEEGHGQGEDVGDESGDYDVSVDGPVFRDGAPEPVGFSLSVGGGSFVEAKLGLQVEGEASVLAFQLFQGDHGGPVGELGEDHLGLAFFEVQGGEDAGAVIF